jgi:hypothetical protein
MSLIRINRKSSAAQLRVFSIAWGAALSFLGYLNVRHHGSPFNIFYLMGSVGLISGILVPCSIRWLYLGLSYATYPVGFLGSYIVLGLLFYLVLTPLSLILRLTGYDPLRLKRSSKLNSYWILRENKNQAVDYFKQT